MNNEYILVEQIPLNSKAMKEPVPHDRFTEYSGVLKLAIKTLTPIFVGTGNIKIDNNGIYLEFAKVNNIPVIPGSSLKGVIRSTTEALSPSCLGPTREEGSTPCKPKGKVCPACRIFGTTAGGTGYQGRVFVEDAVLEGNPANFLEIISIEERWSPQLSHPGFRKFFPHYSQVKGGVDRVESVKNEAVFKSDLRFFNLESWEIGLLLLSLSVSPVYSFCLRLGGAKGKGLGSTKISANGKYAKGTDFIEHRFASFDSANIGEFVNKYLEQASDWGIKEKVIEVIEKLKSSSKLSYEEFLSWCDEDTWAEWVDGEVVLLTPASERHQALRGFLEALLTVYAEQQGLGRVLGAPFQMKTGPDLPGREPDILFISGKNLGRLKKTYLDGPADLVIEITSPESRERDYNEKLSEYERGGVKEYWLLNLEEQRAEFYLLGPEGRYEQRPIDPESIYRSEVIPGFWLKVNWLWQEPLPSILYVLRQQGLIQR